MISSMFTGAALLAAAATVSSSPTSPAFFELSSLQSRENGGLHPMVVEALSNREGSLGKRDIYGEMKAFNLTDPEEMCTPTFNNADDALKVWWKTGAGNMLDYWIKNRAGGADGKATDWWTKLIEFVWKTGAPLDCTTLTGGGCEVPPDLCRKLVEKGMGPFYWIIKQVAIANLAYVNMHEMYLQNGAIENGLDIPQFIEDFTPDPISGSEAPNVFGLLSQILLLGGGTLGAGGISPWGGVASLFGIVFGAVEKYDTPDESEEDIDLNTIVSDYFKSAESSLLSTLHNLIGAGDQQELNPATFSMDYYYDSPVAKVFADGKFLVSDVGVYMDPAIKNAKKNMNQRLGLYVLQQQGMWLQITTGFTEGGCWQEGSSWVDGNCMRFVMPGHDKMTAPCTGPLGCGGKIKIPKELPDKYHDKLVDDYEINWQEVHENAYYCAKKDGEKKMDTSQLPVDGSLPECYFAIDLKKGSWDNVDGEWKQDEEWDV